MAFLVSARAYKYLCFMLTIHHVNQNGEELNEIRELFKEYAEGLNENLCFQSFDEELYDPLKKYGELKGSILLAYWNNNVAGCVALQPLKEEKVCEMKRLFVRSAYRNKGIADELVKMLLNEAREKGYKKMVLDTLQKLQPAIRLYKRFGFEDASAYYANPLSNVLYMQKEL
jgi:N-acetylglutamate synthase-like GNAT family acetyltransferase